MTLRLVNWNLTRNLLAYRDAEFLVVSLGKSGRTWLRVLVHKYLSLHSNAPFDVESMYKAGTTIPNILYTHEMASHYRDNGMLDRFMGKDILPASLARRKQLILLMRDPRDILISSYFHKTRRSKRVDCTLSEFIRDKRLGIERIVWIMNQWYHRFHKHPACLWISYEDMKEDTIREVLKVISFLRIEPDITLAQEAVNFAHFSNMKHWEATGSFSSRRLQPGDAHDPDSFKVRRGKIKGYLDYFDSDDDEYACHQVAKLDPFFGYT